MENNAKIYCKKGSKGGLFLYAEIELKNGEVVTLPICQPQKLYNRKLQFKLTSNLEVK